MVVGGGAGRIDRENVKFLTGERWKLLFIGLDGSWMCANSRADGIPAALIPSNESRREEEIQSSLNLNFF